MVRCAYIPTDNTDIGYFTSKNLSSIDYLHSLKGVKRKNGVNLLMSVLSVPSRGYLVKIRATKNMVRCAYIPTDNTDIGCFTNNNLYLPDYPRPLNRAKRKNGVNLPMSVLAVPFRGYLIKLKGTKKMVKNAYIPTDNTDINYFTNKKFISC